MAVLRSRAHAAAGECPPYSMWWNSRSSSPLIPSGFPFLLALARRLPRDISLPVERLADAAVRRSCWSAWQQSLLCNAACHKSFLPPCPASHWALPLHCLWWAASLSCGNSALSSAGFNRWNFMDLHVSGRKTLSASGCNVEEQIFFFFKCLSVFCFWVVLFCCFWGWFLYAIQDTASLFCY